MKTKNIAPLHGTFYQAVAVALLTLPHATTAQDSSETSLEDLDQKLRILERKLEVAEETAASKPPAPVPVAGEDGFSLKSADGNFAVKFRGLLQTDYRAFLGDTNYNDAKVFKDSSYSDPNDYLRKSPRLVNTFLLRKVRPVFDVTLYKYYTFRVTPDFGGGTTALMDAYGDVNFRPELRLRVGKFKPPIGLERLQASEDNNFVEFNYPSSLIPNRDIGVQLSGDLFGESVNYAAGYFNGAEDGVNKDNDLTNHKDFTGRIFALPFKNTNVNFLGGLGLGVAGSWGESWGDSVNTGLSTIRSSGQNTIFSYRTNRPTTTVLDSNTVRAAGEHWRLNPQGYWYVGPFSLFGEYIISSQKVARSKPVRDTTGGVKTLQERDIRTLKNKSWGVSASWIVTGEPTSYKAVKPRHPLTPDLSGIGAIELVARAGQFLPEDGTFVSNLYADTLASVRKATSFGGGVNWYFNRAVKWVLDYEFTKFEQGAKDWAGKIKNRDDEQVITTRLQINF